MRSTLLLNSKILPSTICSFVLASIFGCEEFRTPPNPEPSRSHLSSGFILDQKEVESLKKSARNGDGAAAFKVHLHYAIGLQDEDAGKTWFDLAAQLGYPVQENRTNVMGKRSNGTAAVSGELLGGAE